MPELIERIPLFKLVVIIKRVATAFGANAARNLFSAFAMFPFLQQLKFEAGLKPLRRQWGASAPRYHYFYAVSPLLEDLTRSAGEDRENTERALRLRAILLLRFCCLFRGIDLARAKRQLDTREATWFLTTRRKGRVKEGKYPVARMEPASICPQAVLSAYRMATADYQGEFLFVSLKRPRRPLSADTINGMTTRWLHTQGLRDFSAHSTRGAAASEMINRGQDPMVVCALGDWVCFDTFMKYYYRIKATQAIAQCLLPLRYRVEAS